MRQRNQPALTTLSLTGALVPDLYDKDDKDPTGGKDDVVFIVES